MLGSIAPIHEIINDAKLFADVCRDSSDDDEKSISGSSTEEFSLDIVEYEVPSDSEDDQADYSTASSGTEEVGGIVDI